MTWTDIAVYFALYLILGAFLDGLFGVDLDPVFWPVSLAQRFGGYLRWWVQWAWNRL